MSITSVWSGCGPPRRAGLDSRGRVTGKVRLRPHSEPSGLDSQGTRGGGSATALLLVLASIRMGVADTLLLIADFPDKDFPIYSMRYACVRERVLLASSRAGTAGPGISTNFPAQVSGRSRAFSGRTYP